MPTLIHFRWEGHSRGRALCGAKRQGYTPRLWRRDWCVVPPPLPKERIVQLYNEDHRSIPCPLCLAKIAADRAASEQKATERPPKGFRYWEKIGEVGPTDDPRFDQHGHLHEDDELLRDEAYADARLP